MSWFRKVNVMYFAGMFFILVLLTVGLMQLAVIPGYENTKVNVVGIESSTMGIKYYYGDPKPKGASTWDFRVDGFNLDPDSEKEGYQNLILVIDTNGAMEKTTFGQEIVDVETWEVPINSTAKKKIEVKTYYFIHYLTLKVGVDEHRIGGPSGLVITTEKDGPWRDFKIGFKVVVPKFKTEGNFTKESFVGILGVEVAEVGWEDPGDGMIASLNFQQGQMLAMYDSLSGRQIQLYTRLPNDPYPNQFRSAVYVWLPFRLFGVNAGYFESWKVGILKIKLRIHVITTDKWLIVQKHGSTDEPPMTEESGGNNLFDWLARNTPLAWLSDWMKAVSRMVWMAVIAISAILILAFAFIFIRGGKK